MDLNRICAVLAALSLLSLVSCDRKEDERGGLVSVNFSNAQAVRTSLSDDRSAVVWREGDAVSLLNAVNAVNEKLVYSSSTASTAEQVPSTAKSLYAVYPYESSIASGAYDVPVTVRAAQVQNSAGVLNGEFYPMTGSGKIEGSAATLSFTPAAAALALNIYKSGLESQESVTSVCLLPTANSGYAGTQNFNLTEGDAVFTLGDCCDTLSLSLLTPLALRDSKPSDPVKSSDQLYITLARQSYTYLEFRVTTDRSVYTVKSNATAIDLTDVDFKVLNINLTTGSIALVLPGISNEGVTQDYDITLKGSFENPDPVDPLSPGNTVDIIPDFSTVGYRHGDAAFPSYGNIVNAPAPSGGDDTQTLQDLIDGAQLQSIVQLQAGTYVLDGILFLDRNDIILRGSGTPASPTTTIRAAGTVKRPLIYVGRTLPGSDKGRLVVESTETVYDEEGVESTVTSLVVQSTSRAVTYGTQVSEEYTPVGRNYVTVRNASIFTKGNRVVVRRPGTDQWISDIKMDCIAQNAKGNVKQWQADDYQLDYERIVTAVEGNRLYLDAPIVQSLDTYYGGGYVLKCSWDRVSGIGIENLNLESEYASDTDEQHAWTAVNVKSAENCWISGVHSRYFSYCLADLASGCRCITVIGCSSSDPKSVVSGSRRYAFHISGGSLCLVKDCSCDSDRHCFVTSARVCGPNAFVNCTATNALSDVGPHHRWATGCLYDCVATDFMFTVQDGGNFGSGHGWQGANFVLWNCDAETVNTRYGGVVCQRPWKGEAAPRRSATNYAVGCNRQGKGRNHNDDLGSRENGEWASIGTKVSLPCAAPSGEAWWPVFSTSSFSTPLSLYQCQKEERENNGINLAGL